MSALASWCARRRFTVISAWVFAVVVLAIAAVGLGSAYTNTSNVTASESGTAAQLLAQANADTSEASTDVASARTGTIVWHAVDTAVDTGAVKTAMEQTLSKVAALPGVKSVISPYTAAGTTQLNAANGYAYATVTVTVDSSANTDTIINTAESARAPNLQVETGGNAFTATPSAGGLTELIGVLAALVILLLMFRSAWAAVLPIVTGVAGVITGLFSVMLLSHVVNLSDNTPTMGALIGLGVGIDYALFIVNRFRRSLTAGATVPAAVRESMTTSGRAVLFAGGTVVVALVGVFVVNIDILTGMARGAALTVALTVLAALTLLPALLALLGPKVLPRRQRKAYVAHAADLVPMSAGAAASAAPHQADTAVTVQPGLSRATAPTTSPLLKTPPSMRWAAAVTRKPGRFAIAAAVLVVVMAIPALSIRLGSADASSDPVGSASRSYADVMTDGFGAGVDAPLLLVAKTPDAAATAAFDRLTAAVRTTDDVHSVTLQAATDAQISVLRVTPSSSAQAASTADLVTTLRDNVIPAAAAGSDMQVYVGGVTAANIDNADATQSKIPVYLVLIAVLGFLLLTIAFRSVLVPLIGAITNLLVLAIGMSVLTAAFQWGWLSGLLGVGGAAPIESLVPVLLIGIVFGLSMDYQVFLVSRMHEEWTHTGDNRRAVRTGLAETTRVISAAALIMLSVFAAFGFAGQRIIAEIGVGLGLAVVVDAFVIKLVLIPSIMSLVGAKNWWYPRWAQRITPHVALEGPDSSDEPEIAAPGVGEREAASAGVGAVRRT